MLNSFIIVLREGFESFLLVAVILAYLRKSGQQWLNTSVYIAIATALAASGRLAYLLNTGVDDATVHRIFGETIRAYASTVCIGAPPHSRTKAASTVELKSITAPGLASSPGWINSSPVGMMPTLGRAFTPTLVWPAASRAPRS